MNRDLLLFEKTLIASREAEIVEANKELIGFSTEITKIQTELPILVNRMSEIDKMIRHTDPLFFQEKEAELWWKFPLLKRLEFSGNKMIVHTETIFLEVDGFFYRCGMFDIHVSFKDTFNEWDCPIYFEIPEEDPDKLRLCPLTGEIPYNKPCHPHIKGIPRSNSICWGNAGKEHTETVLNRLVTARNIDATLRVLFTYLQTNGTELTPYRHITKRGQSFPKMTRKERNDWINKALTKRGLPPLSPAQEKVNWF